MTALTIQGTMSISPAIASRLWGAPLRVAHRPAVDKPSPNNTSMFRDHSAARSGAFAIINGDSHAQTAVVKPATAYLLRVGVGSSAEVSDGGGVSDEAVGVGCSDVSVSLWLRSVIVVFAFCRF